MTPGAHPGPYPAHVQEDGEREPGRLWRAGRLLAQTISVLWAAFWVAGGLGTALDPTDSTPLLTGIVFGLGFGLVPVAPLWYRWVTQALDRRRRREREMSDLDERIAAGLVRVDAARERSEAIRKRARIPIEVRDEWQRLERAHELVVGFVDEGWVTDEAIERLDVRIGRLEQLLVADHATDELGGRSSDALHEQVRELTALLVALADDALERQVALTDGDDVVPTTLRDAQERLAAEHLALDELSDPSGALEELTRHLNGQRRGTAQRRRPSTGS